MKRRNKFKRFQKVVAADGSVHRLRTEIPVKFPRPEGKIGPLIAQALYHGLGHTEICCNHMMGLSQSHGVRYYVRNVFSRNEYRQWTDRPASEKRLGIQDAIRRNFEKNCVCDVMDKLHHPGFDVKVTLFDGGWIRS